MAIVLRIQALLDVAVVVCLTAAGAYASTQAEDYSRAEQFIQNGDLIAGLRLIRPLAEAGYAPAQARLGEILDLAEEDREAVVWYRKAALQGHPAGAFGLGMEYATGEGIEKDMQQAYQWIHRAAEQDYLLAVEALAAAYRTGGLGRTVDLKQAEHWSARARELRAADPRQTPVTTQPTKGKGK